MSERITGRMNVRTLYIIYVCSHTLLYSILSNERLNVITFVSISIYPVTLLHFLYTVRTSENIHAFYCYLPKKHLSNLGVLGS